MKICAARNAFLLASCWIKVATAACIPDYPEKLLADPAVLRYPAVIAAFEDVERYLSDFYINTTRDGLSFAVVCHLFFPQTITPTLT